MLTPRVAVYERYFFKTIELLKMYRLLKNDRRQKQQHRFYSNSPAHRDS